MLDTDALTGGFADPVFAAQAVFRLLMDCMAQPGTLARLPALATAPGALGPAQAAVALTLSDADTPIWLDPASDSAALRAWLSFHAGAVVTDDPAAASFAVLGRGSSLPDTLPLGSQDYPDRAATVILEVAGLADGERFRLAGPGIAGVRDVAISGLPADFADRRRANHALFPRGIDVVLTAGDQILALPRSTTFTPLES